MKHPDQYDWKAKSNSIPVWIWIFQFYSGSYACSGTREITKNENMKQVKKKIVHPNYLQVKYDYDIAILYLKEDLEFNSE